MRSGRAKYWVAALGSVLLGAVVVAALTFPLSSEALRRRVIDALAVRLDSTIELGDFRARLFPVLHAEGRDLVIRHRGRTDVPPLISVASFSVDAGVLPLLRKHVRKVEVVGLRIQIPPDHADARPDDRRRSDAAPIGTAGASRSDASSRPAATVVVDELVARDAALVLIPDERTEPPKVWSIHQLHMSSVSLGTRMPFEATLTNDTPPGEIATAGAFGPWKADRPGATPLSGSFTFENANLAVFKGVYGTLSAHGTFAGVLGRIDIHGETDTPDFGLTTALHSMPLHAVYHSVVDGTNGDTVLERIEATLFKTRIVASGAVLDQAGAAGHLVRLDAAIDRGALEDVLRLAVKTPKPPMTGALTLRTKFVLPPGEANVVDRLQLKGRFEIHGARFTDRDVARKIAELSVRGRGRRSDHTPAAPVDSEFKGEFAVRAATLTVPDVEFTVPGATVKLAGRYGLESERLDFRGKLLMAAKVSETMTGFKRILLKIADPLFRRRGGGSSVPIKITGTRGDPSFGLDARRIFRR